MTTFKILTFFIFFTLSISNVFANSSTSSYLKNEINEAHKAYLFNDTATGLYALNSLARLLEFLAASGWPRKALTIDVDVKSRKFIFK